MSEDVQSAVGACGAVLAAKSLYTKFRHRVIMITAMVVVLKDNNDGGLAVHNRQAVQLLAPCPLHELQSALQRQPSQPVWPCCFDRGHYYGTFGCTMTTVKRQGPSVRVLSTTVDWYLRHQCSRPGHAVFDHARPLAAPTAARGCVPPNSTATDGVQNRPIGAQRRLAFHSTGWRQEGKPARNFSATGSRQPMAKECALYRTTPML